MESRHEIAPQGAEGCYTFLPFRCDYWAIVKFLRPRKLEAQSKLIQGLFRVERIQHGLVRAIWGAGGDLSLAGKKRAGRFELPAKPKMTL